MPYAPECCSCDRTGMCTTRWYPLQGVSYFGNPDDCFVYDFGGVTTGIAITEFEGQFYTWVLGGSGSIAKVEEPDGGNPIAIWKKKIEYHPPSGAVGIDVGPVYLEATELRTIGKDADAAVVIGSTTQTALVSTTVTNYPLYFGPSIIKYDFSDYQGNQGVLNDLAAADVVCKVDLAFNVNPGETEEYSVGGYFRLGITQFLPSSICGTSSFTTEDHDDGSVDWSNPNGAKEDDSVYAYCSGENEESHYLAGYFYLFGCVPDNAVSLAGITVQVKRFASDDSSTVWVKDSQVRIRVDAGTTTSLSENKADSGNWPTSSSIQNYGGASDLWGLSISQLEIVVRTYLSVEFGNNGVDAFVDQVNVIVTYLDENGDPLTVTVNDFKEYNIPEGNGTTNHSIGPSVAIWSSSFGRANPGAGLQGFYTDYLTEVFPIGISGADLADAIQPYLDPIYTVEGTGTISETTKITLTFTHDGSLDNVYDSGGDFEALDGEGHWYISIRGPTVFPHEAANLHVINESGEILWSRCAVQGVNVIFGNIVENRRRSVEKIEYDSDGELISVLGIPLWSMGKWSLDGEMQDHGAFIGSDSIGVLSFRRIWRCLDREGYAYTQDGTEISGISGVDLTLVKWGPSGQDATLNQIWALSLPFAIGQWTVTDDAIVCGGTYPGEGQVKVALVALDGTLGWVTDIPSNSFGSSVGFSMLFDVWTDKNVVVVSAYHGAYMLDYATGTLTAYFPHGARCYSAMRMNNPDGDDYLVLTGATANIDVETFDIDPETLT